jgi:hypothetical protein
MIRLNAKGLNEGEKRLRSDELHDLAPWCSGWPRSATELSPPGNPFRKLSGKTTRVIVTN